MSDPSDQPPQDPVLPSDTLSDEEAARRARRALLKAGVFAPAVLATLLTSRDALAAKSCSCGPGPDCGPARTCNPPGSECIPRP